MEIDDLVIALEKTISLLRESESSFYAALSVEELIDQLTGELNKRKKMESVDLKKLKYLYGPTGSIQEVSIDNGWGDKFLEIANVIDQ